METFLITSVFNDFNDLFLSLYVCSKALKLESEEKLVLQSKFGGIKG